MIRYQFILNSLGKKAKQKLLVNMQIEGKIPSPDSVSNLMKNFESRYIQ